MVKRVETLRDLRLVLETWRRRDETVGLVSTMGALHYGHLSLLRQAQSLSTRVVTTIFVNPLQFTASDNIDAYPRTLEQDEKLLTENGCDLLFCPTVDTMYPANFATTVDPGPLAKLFEGAARPTYFTGVATVVTKLLMQVMPDYAFFGEKDFQQFRIIEQVVNDLHIPVGIIPVPTYRDHDGLAMSSRNRFLSPEERARATLLPKIIETAIEEIHSDHDIETTLIGAREQLAEGGLAVEYFELISARTFEPARDLRRPARLIAAVKVGQTRLLDNMAV